MECRIARREVIDLPSPPSKRKLSTLGQVRRLNGIVQHEGMHAAVGLVEAKLFSNHHDMTHAKPFPESATAEQ